MPQYEVIWRWAVYADDPQDAADQAIRAVNDLDYNETEVTVSEIYTGTKPEETA